MIKIITTKKWRKTLQQLDEAITELKQMKGSLLHMQDLHNGLWERYQKLQEEYESFMKKKESEIRKLETECNTLRNKIKKLEK